ncbi:hypothetical protein PTTG_02179 [Puccinia triticina 1-1 BBBD Race 1]|uniref:MICOS complex subunit n=2 Tax=Puccinia triticina TaxID=208348 RepID=A0A180GDL3_PUCT1|nr:uncharacterized protein PtA15_5A448 [Puccinia triticina]OAV90826.1 hypothetical protein PTTG_02179 [Puccinia triticina 1-1 BBBD Race 1]WAQ84875.1 hypothetical protein PtA15_5A448 [Puccinia triticina]
MAATPSPDLQASYPSRTQLPIYDKPCQEIILVKTELPLQPQVRWARQNIQSFKKDLENRFNFVLGHGMNIEKKVAGTLGSLIDQKESTSSSVLCVGIGTMTGSILARNRAFPLRFLSPLAFFILSSNQFLPSTTHNFKSYLFKLQDHHFPQSAAARDEVIKRGVEGVEWLTELKHRMFLKTAEVVKDGSQVFEKYSGLNISHGSSAGKTKTE